MSAASDSFAALSKAMRAANADSVIVDVTMCNGGHSILVPIVMYFIGGAQAAMAATESMYSIPRFSALYFDQVKGHSLEEERRKHGPNRQCGDYGWPSVLREGSGGPEGAARRSPTFARYWHGDGVTDATVKPNKVYVLTSSRTMSAALRLTMELLLMGTRVVGANSEFFWPTASRRSASSLMLS
jgi:hypothetical protein